MTHLQLTPEQPPAGSDAGEGVADGDIPAPEADELRRAQARRLEIMERERASDEGMATTQPRADEQGGKEHGGAVDERGEDDDDA
ncbi:MAG TPA: hypothetical protein VK987_06825 [Anaerolineae bacterium]|nr:hypothetical protein [Anaerolineae bacterium]